MSHLASYLHISHQILPARAWSRVQYLDRSYTTLCMTRSLKCTVIKPPIPLFSPHIIFETAQHRGVKIYVTILYEKNTY